MPVNIHAVDQAIMDVMHDDPESVNDYLNQINAMDPTPSVITQAPAFRDFAPNKPWKVLAALYRRDYGLPSPPPSPPPLEPADDFSKIYHDLASAPFGSLSEDEFFRGIEGYLNGKLTHDSISP